MEYIVKSRSKRTKKFIEHIMPSMIKQLGLTNSRKSVLIDVCRAGVPDGMEGCAIPLPELDFYVVALKPAKWHELGVTLAHEMVHVKQMAKGMLRKEGKSDIWRGKKYGKRTKYLDSPWEIEAFSKQEIIFRKAIN
jgi:hypothetical protein